MSEDGEKPPENEEIGEETSETITEEPRGLFGKKRGQLRAVKGVSGRKGAKKAWAPPKVSKEVYYREKKRARIQAFFDRLPEEGATILLDAIKRNKIKEYVHVTDKDGNVKVKPKRLQAADLNALSNAIRGLIELREIGRATEEFRRLQEEVAQLREIAGSLAAARGMV